VTAVEVEEGRHVQDIVAAGGDGDVEFARQWKIRAHGEQNGA
jgi:hypothetical protein